jgi:outer membrane protein TolC
MISLSASVAFRATAPTARRRAAVQVIAAVALLMPLPAAAADGEPGGPINIVEAMERARDRNEDVAILAEHVKQAGAVRVEILSGMLPLLTASASYGFNKEVKKEIGGGESMLIQPGESWSLGGQASIGLLDPSLFPSLAAAGKTKKASEALLEAGEEEVLHATAQAYVTALFAEEAVLVRERELVTRKAHRDRVEALLAADEALALDLKRAELDVLSAESALASARVDVSLAMDALSALMGDDPGTPWQLAPLSASLPPPPVAPLSPDEMADGTKAGIAGSPGLAAQELLQASTKLHAVSGGLSILPKLSLVAAYDKMPSSFRSPDGYTWSVTFNLSWTLFDGGLTAASVKEGLSKATEAMLEKEKAEKALKAGVHSAWLKFNLALQNRDTAAERLDVAVQAKEMAEERYAAGLATGLEVDDALDALAASDLGLVGEEMNVTLAWLEYLRSSGQFMEFFEAL